MKQLKKRYNLNSLKNIIDTSSFIIICQKQNLTTDEFHQLKVELQQKSLKIKNIKNSTFYQYINLLSLDKEQKFSSLYQNSFNTTNFIIYSENSFTNFKSLQQLFNNSKIIILSGFIGDTFYTKKYLDKIITLPSKQIITQNINSTLLHSLYVIVQVLDHRKKM